MDEKKTEIGLWLRRIIVALFFMLFFVPQFSYTVFAETTDEAETVYLGEFEGDEGFSRAIRSAYLQRLEKFSFGLYTDYQILYTDLDRLKPMIFEHTGAGNEGDYLKYGFYYNPKFSFSNAYKDGKRYCTATFEAVYHTSRKQEEEITQRLSEIYSDLKLDGKTDYEKTCLIYDYFTNHVQYDFEHGSDYDLKYTAYAALMNGKAVCEGYALLLYRMLNDQGIDSRMIIGGNHAWNIVKLDEYYYYLDSTWDNGGSRNYFLFGCDNLRSHTLGEDFKTESFQETYPICPTEYDLYHSVESWPPIGWLTYKNKTFYYGEDGKPVQGFQKIDGKWYYFTSSGMTRGWMYYGGKQYYFDGYGVMATGVKTIYDEIYYFNSRGELLTGAQKIGGYYFYLNPDKRGAMHTGWLELNGKKYYFESDGKMVTGWHEIDGKIYGFNTKGVMQTGVIQSSKGVYYLDPETGILHTGWLTYKDGKKYYFDEKGKMVTGWKKIGADYYGFNKKGQLQTGWIDYRNNKYYAREDGTVAINCSVVIDGKAYIFNKKGICINP